MRILASVFNAKGVKEMNRIEEAINEAENRIKSMTDEEIEGLKQMVSLGSNVITFCQNKQLEAHAKGLISTEESSSIRNILDRWGSASLAEKAVIRKIISELARIVEEGHYGVF